MKKKINDTFTSIDSDHISGAKYDSFARKATIRFKNGYQYDVHGMSADAFRRFMDAPSHGQHYHTFIKDNYAIERTK